MVLLVVKWKRIINGVTNRFIKTNKHTKLTAWVTCRFPTNYQTSFTARLLRFKTCSSSSPLRLLWFQHLLPALQILLKKVTDILMINLIRFILNFTKPLSWVSILFQEPPWKPHSLQKMTSIRTLIPPLTILINLVGLLSIALAQSNQQSNYRFAIVFKIFLQSFWINLTFWILALNIRYRLYEVRS